MQRRLFLLLGLIALATTALNVGRYCDYLIDDQFISLRYARNLVEGNGLVFNPGERVEGFTNPSYVLVAALCMIVGLDPLLTTRIISFLCALLAIGLTVRLERLGPRLDTGFFPLPALLLIAGPAFAYWAVASFETMPFTSLVVAAIAALATESKRQRGHLSAVLFVALLLTRPEGVFVFAVAGSAFLIADLATAGAADRQPVMRRHAVNAAMFAGAAAAIEAARWLYYGRLLPNTFYAKVTMGSEQLTTGLRGFGQWAAAYPVHAAALLAPLLLFTARGRHLARAHPSVGPIYVVSLTYALYVVAIGGDFMPFFRFYLPILPLLSLLAAWSLACIPRPAVGLASFLVAAQLFTSHLADQPYRAFVSHRTTVVGRRVGEWLARQRAPGDLIAVNTAGAIPYTSRLPAIDMLGLTDAVIAARPIYIVSTGWAGHRKGWGEYVVNRQPRVILWYNTAGSAEPFYMGDHELADNPFFRFFYARRIANLPVTDGEADHILERFLGRPFNANGEAISPELSFRSVVHTSPISHTEVYPAPTTVHYFESSSRDDALWKLRRDDGIGGFVDRVASAWRSAAPRPTADPIARRAVEELCEAARLSVEAGDYGEAKQILSHAAQLNREVRSPLVYHYIANVAFLTGDLWAAIPAQKEALFLQPANQLYRENLVRLLTAPYKKSSES
jgi:hypothetical protein